MAEKSKNFRRFIRHSWLSVIVFLLLVAGIIYSAWKITETYKKMPDFGGIVTVAFVNQHRRRHIDPVGSHHTLTKILMERKGACGLVGRGAGNSHQLKIARQRPVLAWLAVHRIESYIEFHLATINLDGKIVLIYIDTCPIVKEAIPAFL